MRFTVTAERTPRGWWTLVSDNGAVSQTRRLDQAPDEMREAVAYLAGLPESEVEIEVVPTLDSAITSDLAVARELRDQADAARSAASLMSRMAASEMRAAGLTVRDIGVVLGVSYQRAQQLLGEVDRLRSQIKDSPEEARLIVEAEKSLGRSGKDLVDA